MKELKRFMLPLFAAMTIISAISCKEETDFGHEYFYIEGETSGIECDKGQKSQQFVIRSNRSWQILDKTDSGWCRFFPAEGKDDGIVNLSITENETFDERFANYAFIVNGVEQPVLFQIRQGANSPYITIADAQKVVSVPVSGGEVSIPVKSNVVWDYTFSSYEWIEVVSVSATELKLHAADNNDVERSVVLTVFCPELPGLTQEITITQSSAEFILEEDFNWLKYGSDIHYTTTGETRYDLWTEDEKSRGWYSSPVTSSKDEQLCYARQGFVKLGKTNYGGDLISPALSKIEGSIDVEVTFKATAYISSGGAKDDNELYVSVIGPGSVSESLFIIDNYPNSSKIENGADYDVWDPAIAERKFIITGATAETKIKFLGRDYDLNGVGQGKNRIFLDDIKVRKCN